MNELHNGLGYFNFKYFILIKKLTVMNVYSIQQKSHYDTLQLSKSCTKKEIRDAFISLSKKVGLL